MINSVDVPTVATKAPARNRGKFLAGVRPYAVGYYVPEYVPAETDSCAPFASGPPQAPT